MKLFIIYLLYNLIKEKKFEEIKNFIESKKYDKEFPENLISYSIDLNTVETLYQFGVKKKILIRGNLFLGKCLNLDILNFLLEKGCKICSIDIFYEEAILNDGFRIK
jgi:hypothetical protein